MQSLRLLDNDCGYWDFLLFEFLTGPYNQIATRSMKLGEQCAPKRTTAAVLEPSTNDGTAFLHYVENVADQTRRIMRT